MGEGFFGFDQGRLVIGPVGLGNGSGGMCSDRLGMVQGVNFLTDWC